MSKDKAAATIERLRKAAVLGIKVSAVYGKAQLSPFRIKTILLGYKNGKPLTEDESNAINAVLDSIKEDL